MASMDDAAFVQILDHALADATQRAGHWLACRPGCNACCHGVFAISSLDADRLNRGYQELRLTDPERAGSVATRCEETRARLSDDFPGDPLTGLLGEDEDSEARFQDFANEEVCPVLNPESGTCDLYEHRPVTCRVFGPPVRSSEGFGVCELCFQGAPETEIERCELHLPPSEQEDELIHPHGDWRTIVAFALKT